MSLTPVPDALQAGTSCDYCGTSYLVMHEIEALKAQILEQSNRIKAYEIRQNQ